MNDPAEGATIVLDPRLVLNIWDSGYIKMLRDSHRFQFAMTDHFSAGIFIRDELARIKAAVRVGEIPLRSTEAIYISDLLPLRDMLALYEIVSIGLARNLGALLASNSPAFRREAGVVLGKGSVLSRGDLMHSFDSTAQQYVGWI